MAPFFAHRSCDPFTPANVPCTLGNYVNYAINASGAADIAAGVRFAKENNIRLVIRNTGHDYLGRSTGAYSLGIWTHHLNAISFLTYTSPVYTGPAFKLGAGVQVREAYAFASSQNKIIIGGACQTVGLAGGYTQGGGHSPLSSKYGLAADQTLEWEVVLANGSFATASSTHNRDLYWAMSGGGAGAYAVAVSLTVRAHEDPPITTGVSLDFDLADMNEEFYYELVGLWHKVMPSLTAANGTLVYYVTNTTFALTPLAFPGSNATTVVSLLSPFTNGLKRRNVNYSLSIQEFPNYLSFYNSMFSEFQIGEFQNGGWLIPKSAVEENSEGVTAAIRNVVRHGGTFIGVGLDVGHDHHSHPDDDDAITFNAVLPAWRTAQIVAIITLPWNNTSPWSKILHQQKTITDELVPRLQALSPEGDEEQGSYGNEADFNQPDWQRLFYGLKNYKTLLKIKQAYDPESLFYNLKAVGSEVWVVGDEDEDDDDDDGDGRMCRV
ncbi:MAG: hypothetical protein M1834_000145 [Cirrosporium novae-zelandiae]|nr:MAG: hypothetical protein M1834_000145 [Cirrosporium novae-zelandiae]